MSEKDQPELWPDYPLPEVAAETRPTAPQTLTVAELGRLLQRGVERAVPRQVWVEGEVVSARAAPSGHVYFTLKDEREEAAIDVVVYRASLTQRLRGLVRDGARVRARGRPQLWVARGKLQLTADRLEAAGRGAILEAIERLKEKLAAEGLFDPARKRALPKDPRTVGVVTSAGGAVIHDICKVAARRGGAHVLLAPARVSGTGAGESLTRSLQMLERVDGVDVIIVGRGGGSFDELLAFSDEALVRAVASCRVPVVSAVGHEVDVTLTDFAADRRAATPSQAAEMCVPDRGAIRREVTHLRERLVRWMGARMGEERSGLVALARSLDARHVLAPHRTTLEERRARLQRVDPSAVVARERGDLLRVTDRMTSLVQARVARERGDFRRLVAGLEAMSPLSVLSRGYAIATHEGVAVRKASEVEAGDSVTVRVHEGSFDAVVRK